MFLMREGLQCRTRASSDLFQFTASKLKQVWWGCETIPISRLLFSPLPKLGHLSRCDVSFDRENFQRTEYTSINLKTKMFWAGDGMGRVQTVYKRVLGCKICSNYPQIRCFTSYLLDERQNDGNLNLNTTWNIGFVDSYVWNKRAKFGAKIFTHFGEITIFVLGRFILTDPVES